MTFREFFRALWDRDPFRWQEELAEKAMSGTWPHIGLPTAAGKTAAIDVAVFAMAMRAPNAARRIFFVVDRRVIVDEAAERALKLKTKLDEAPPGSALAEIAGRLRSLGGDSPLEIAVLRGGKAREDSWASSPVQPAVICSTVDQIGSSLLFRAYGASEYARPIRAGMAACDSLILLDEAHTSRAFSDTLRAIERYREWAAEPVDLPFDVAEMTATPAGKDTIRENEERDFQDEVLKRRWVAAKRARLVTVDGDDEALAEAIAKEARRFCDAGAKVIGAIANRVATARKIFEKLRTAADADAILLIGRVRPWDRDRIWEDWKNRIALGRERDPEKPVYVVATQCIEVGANLDFDALATEIASMDAIEQRFGRLDRDGQHAEKFGASQAAIVARKEQIAKKYEDFLYGAAMPAAWHWLEEHATTEKKKGKPKELYVDMSVWALRRALDASGRDGMLMPASPSPVLLPAHVDLLSQTSPEPEITPEPAVFLHGPESGPADVQVVWRADLDPDNTDTWVDTVAICPPASLEMMNVPFAAVQRWLARRPAADVTDIEGGRIDDTRKEAIPTKPPHPFLCWRGIEESEVFDRPEQLRPGMTIVVQAEIGGCDRWGWAPGWQEPVKDIGDAVHADMHRPMLRLNEKLATQWGYRELAAALRNPEKDFHELTTGFTGDPSVEKAVAALRDRKPRVVAENDMVVAFIGADAFDQNDARAFYLGCKVPLDEHLRNCAAVVERFAAGLPERLKRTVLRAVEMHDIGKADPRFQAWLRGGNPVHAGELLAKSAKNGQNRAAVERARELAGYPKGGRHELTSVALIAVRERDEDLDWDLLLHLVASHHGRCRPFAPVVNDEDPVAVTFGGVSVSSKHGLERLGSGVSERFWKLTRRYGWYGLAYLESLVRLADQQQSEAEQDVKKKGAHV